MEDFRRRRSTWINKEGEFEVYEEIVVEGKHILKDHEERVY